MPLKKLTQVDLPVSRPGAEAADPNQEGTEALLLILTCWPDGQAFNLIHVRRRLLQRPTGTKPRGHHLDALLLPLVHAPQRHAISWEGAPAYSGAARGYPLMAWLWRPGDLVFWGPRALKQLEDEFWQVTTLRALRGH